MSYFALRHLATVRDALRGLRRSPQHDPARFHHGDYKRLVRLHELHVRRLQRGDSLPPVGPYLLQRIMDERTMRVAYEDLRRSGGNAPGPDGISLRTLDTTQPFPWTYLREIAADLRAGTYRPGPVRRVSIPKGPGRGTRTLAIQNLRDRIVDRAILRILQPLVDPHFSDFSFGFRPHRGRHHALAMALALTEATCCRVWVLADIARMFDAVPRERLLDVCRARFPEDVAALLAVVTSHKSRRGLRQGSPLSPFLGNLFLDHFLDRPWANVPGRRPLLRFADDLMVPCANLDEAAQHLDWLATTVRLAGTPLRTSPPATICDLGAGHQAEWLGFAVSWSDGTVRVRLAEAIWDALREGLRYAHVQDDVAPHEAAIAMVRGWFDQLGPCYPHEVREVVVQRAYDMARAFALDEFPVPAAWLAVWQRAFARWERLRADCRRISG